MQKIKNMCIFESIYYLKLFYYEKKNLIFFVIVLGIYAVCTGECQS